jgi:hypothetical protein
MSQLRCSVLIALLGCLMWLPTPTNSQEPITGVIDQDSSSPPDLNSYTRAPIPEDYYPFSVVLPEPSPENFPLVSMTDIVVVNTDPRLRNDFSCSYAEPSIAVNPDSKKEIVITAFAGFWGPGLAAPTAPLFQSLNGGGIWTRQRTIPAPPNVPGTPRLIDALCRRIAPAVTLIGPFDQTVDFQAGHGGLLSGTFLTGASATNNANIYSGTTQNPAKLNQWDWRTNAGTAVRTNCAAGGACTAVNRTDQPWLLANRQPPPGGLQNVYVAYDDFTVQPRGMRVAVSVGQNFLDFSVDQKTGDSSTGGVINPGHRIAVDPSTGTVYSLFQLCTPVGNCNSDPKYISYVINRSEDGGRTWPLAMSNNGCDNNGGGGQCVLVRANSTQPTPKFCGVNALLGGVDHIAVDPQNSDVYVVYGDRNGAGINRLSIIRLGSNGTGGLKITGGPFLVTSGLAAGMNTALPSVTVASDTHHTVAVLYDACDTTGATPMITAYLSISTDGGKTWQDRLLQTFASPDPVDANPRQRVLGDYQQLKSVGTVLYGVYSGNGMPFGRPMPHIDPIFFTADVGP